MGADVSTGTSGDYIGDIDTIKGLIEEAKNDFMLSMLQKDSASDDSLATDQEHETEVESEQQAIPGLTDISAPMDIDESDVDWSSLLYCSDSAWDDFQQFTKLNFIELILKASKDKKAYTLRYMETTRVIIQRVAVVVVSLIAVLGTMYYFIHNKKIQEYTRQVAEQKKLAQIAAEQAKEKYFSDLISYLKDSWG